VHIVRLRHSGDRPFLVDFHPRISVLAGLDAERRSWLADRLRAILHGDVESFEGTLLIHGFERDLDAEVIADLSLGAPEILISRADLPGATPKVIDIAAPVPEPLPEVPDVPSSLEADVERLTDELTNAERARDEAAAELRRADEAASSRVAETDDPAADLASAEAALSQAAEDVRTAAARLDELLSAEPDPAIAEAARTRAGLDRRIDELTTRRTELVAALGELQPIDPAPLSAALANWRAARDDPGEPDADAQALAARIEEVAAALAAAGTAARPSEADVAAARDELAAARAALADLALHMPDPPLSDDDVAELEAAHDAVEDAESGRGFGTRRRLDKAREREAAVLERLGIESYGAYLLRRTNTTPVSARPEGYDDARAAVVAAEAALGDIEARRNEPDGLGDLETQLTQMTGEAAALLGGPVDDAAEALRAIRHRTADLGAAEAALRAALADSDLTGDALEAAAVARLTEADERHARRAAVEAELGAVDGDLAEATAARAARMPPADEDDAGHAIAEARRDLDAARDAEVTALRAKTDAEQRLADRDAARARASSLEAARDGARGAADQARTRAATLAQTLSDARVALEAARAAREAALAAHAQAEARSPRREAGPVIDLTGVDRATLEVYLLSRVAGQRDVGTAGSLPLVIDDAFAGLPANVQSGVRDVIERYSAIIQVIYLTNDESVEEWVRAGGESIGSVQRFAPTGARAE
jgi:hypothetical protein